MLVILQQFYRALISTMTACRQKSAAQDVEVDSLTKKLEDMTVERDLLVVEQEEALKLIEEMTEELDKQ